MKGINEFIIEIKNPFSETFKTKGGLEIYGDKNFSADRLSNRIGKVISTPYTLNSEIEVGYEVLIDPTILYEQSYRGITQSSLHIVDVEKNLYRIDPKLIVLYRKNKNSEWNGFLENCLGSRITSEEKEKTSSLIIMPENTKEKYVKGRAKLLYANSKLINEGLKNNDELIINPNGGVSFWIEGEEFWWLRNSDIYAKA